MVPKKRQKKVPGTTFDVTERAVDHSVLKNVQANGPHIHAQRITVNEIPQCRRIVRNTAGCRYK